MMDFAPELQPIAGKVLRGERLTAADGLALYRSPHLLQVGSLAQHVRRQRHGEVVTYVLNCHLNPTNICRLRCPLCAFSRSAGEAGAYCLSVAEVLELAERYRDQGPDEFHIVGGINDDLPFSYALTLLAGLRERFPGISLKAFTAVEIEQWARVAGLSVEACLCELRAAGLDSLPGGGAEIFAERVRRIICPEKVSGARWLEIHGAAHALGIPTTATMLYGHIETLEERVEHLLALRELQDRTGGFLAFIPLAYHPGHTQIGGRETTGRDDLQTIAVSRLLLDNIPNIKAYWVMLGVKIAQLALLFGANDLDGTVMEEKICHMAGGESPRGLAEEALRQIILDAGGEPARRDSRHQIKETPATR
ncbi:MAG TPA: aminofutalosine synthase MqnE [Armatimonadota bacterium]|jgi:aminodeoxyfutalosine synthase